MNSNNNLIRVIKKTRGFFDLWSIKVVLFLVFQTYITLRFKILKYEEEKKKQIQIIDKNVLFVFTTSVEV